MSTNHTTNYNLNQWEATDQVLRTEFNADNAKIDAALKSHDDELAGLEAAIGAKGNCKIVFGTYTGTGTAGQDTPNTLTFSHKPLLVSIMPQNTEYSEVLIGFHAVRSSNFLYTNADRFNSKVTLSWGETSLSWWGSDSDYQYNISGQTYCYVALLALDE